MKIELFKDMDKVNAILKNPQIYARIWLRTIPNPDEVIYIEQPGINYHLVDDKNIITVVEHEQKGIKDIEVHVSCLERGKARKALQQIFKEYKEKGFYRVFTYVPHHNKEAHNLANRLGGKIFKFMDLATLYYKYL